MLTDLDAPAVVALSRIEVTFLRRAAEGVCWVHPEPSKFVRVLVDAGLLEPRGLRWRPTDAAELALNTLSGAESGADQ